MSLEAVYQSTIHNPISFWIGNAVLLAVLASTSLDFLRRWAFAFVALIALDAWINGAYSPLPKGLPQGVTTAVAFGFVWLGDFRYFLLVERYVRGPHATATTVATAAGLAMVVPLCAAPLLFVGVPDRLLWLAYEITFFLFAAALRMFWLPRRLERSGARPNEDRAPHEAIARWVLNVTVFQIAQYGLWVLADLVLLARQPIGYGIRLLPNYLYYLAFVPFVWWTAPRALRSRAP